MSSLQNTTPARSLRRLARKNEKKRMKRLEKLFSTAYNNDNFDNVLSTCCTNREIANNRANTTFSQTQDISSSDLSDDTNREHSLPYEFPPSKNLLDWSPTISEDEYEQKILGKNYESKNKKKSKKTSKEEEVKSPNLSKNLASLSFIDNSHLEKLLPQSSTPQDTRYQITSARKRSPISSQASSSQSHNTSIDVPNKSKKSSSAKRQKMDDDRGPSEEITNDNLSDLSDLEFSEEALKALDEDMVKTQKKLDDQKITVRNKEASVPNSRQFNIVKKITDKTCNEESGIGTGIIKNLENSKIAGKNHVTEEYSLLDDDFNELEWD